MIPSYLSQRNGTYYYRIRIPSSIRCGINTNELRFSLRTRAELLQTPINRVMGAGIRFLEARDQGKFRNLRQRALAEQGAKMEMHLQDLDDFVTPVLAWLKPLSMPAIEALCMIKRI